MRRALLFAAALLVAMVAGRSAARAWDPFLVENDHVEDGNERMAADDPETALGHYDRAARELPDAPGVHLNRGLALLESGELDRARESFLRAAEPPADASIRADAYYDLGLAFYREGDAAATEENTQEATRLFREAADAFRRSLRLRPGNADAGWNLELALRRIREQEERQQEQQDQQQQDQQQQDQQQQDQQQPGDDSSDGEDPSQREQSEQGEGADSRDQARGEPPPSGGADDRALPPEHRRVLDALQDGEENLERHRARSRARRENRRVEQDW